VHKILIATDSFDQVNGVSTTYRNILKYSRKKTYVIHPGLFKWKSISIYPEVQICKEPLKAYKKMDFGKLWAVVSYRRSLDGAQYIEGNTVASQKLQYFTPILGVNYKNYMFSYTYSSLLGSIKFDNGGFHQFTLGINLFCKPDKYQCNCPAVN
jgi:hypothetical protein